MTRMLPGMEKLFLALQSKNGDTPPLVRKHECGMISYQLTTGWRVVFTEEGDGFCFQAFDSLLKASAIYTLRGDDNKGLSNILDTLKISDPAKAKKVK